MTDYEPSIFESSRQFPKIRRAMEGQALRNMPLQSVVTAPRPYPPGPVQAIARTHLEAILSAQRLSGYSSIGKRENMRAGLVWPPRRIPVKTSYGETQKFRSWFPEPSLTWRSYHE